MTVERARSLENLNKNRKQTYQPWLDLQTDVLQGEIVTVTVILSVIVLIPHFLKLFLVSQCFDKLFAYLYFQQDPLISPGCYLRRCGKHERNSCSCEPEDQEKWRCSVNNTCWTTCEPPIWWQPNCSIAVPGPPPLVSKQMFSWTVLI